MKKCCGYDVFKNKNGTDVCVLYYTEPFVESSNHGVKGHSYNGSCCGSIYVHFVPEIAIGDLFRPVYGQAFMYQGKMVQPIDDIIIKK